MFNQRGRVHVKHVFNFTELETKARQRTLYRYVRQGRRMIPQALTPEAISRWYTRMPKWNDQLLADGSKEYVPTKPHFPVYEFRDGKFRPLRSAFYMHEIKRRHAGTRSRAVMKLEELIEEKEKRFKEFNSRRPRTAKRSTQKKALILHNQKLLELYATKSAAIQLQLLRMEQLRQYIQNNSSMTEAEQEREVHEIQLIMSEKTRELERTQKEEFLTQSRIKNIMEFPKAPASDRIKLEKIAQDFKNETTRRAAADAEYAEYESNIGGATPKMKWKWGRTQLRYWIALNSLMTGYMVAHSKWGVTLSRMEREDIENTIQDCRTKIVEYKKFSNPTD
jgi:hypothetical protein